MIDCDELLDRLHAQPRTQVHLALLAQATPVAEMHLDLALHSGEQTRTAEEFCDDD